MKANHFGYKNDSQELIEVCQFLRETIPNIRVEREWYIVFDRKTGKYVGYSKTVVDDTKYRYRNPDILIRDKKSGELLLCVEIDGSVHDVYVEETEERNEQYAEGNVPLLPITKSSIETSIFDEVYNKVKERLKIE